MMEPNDGDRDTTADTHPQNNGRDDAESLRHDRQEPPRADQRTLVQQQQRRGMQTANSNSNIIVPWYFPSLLSRAADYMDSPTPNEQVDSQRERQDDSRGRASEDDDREEEPWNEDGQKRVREEVRDDDNGDSNSDSQSHNKRRRMTDASSLAFYDVIHASTEVQRMVFENTSPGSYLLIFYALGCNDFALRWAFILYVGHTLEVALTDFAHHSGHWRLMPLIPADIHVCIDTFVWNQPIVTCMLLYPHWFGDKTTALEIIGTLIILAMLGDTVISLKDDYQGRKQQITVPAYRRHVEAGFVDILVSFTVTFVLIVLAQVWCCRWLLWIGVAIFNFPPVYFLWAHRQRIQYGIRMSNDEKSAGITSGNGNGKKVA